jgi:hypothetical protein
MPIDFKSRGSQCAREAEDYEMNKCLSLVHLTGSIGPQSSGSDESNSRFLRSPD